MVNLIVLKGLRSRLFGSTLCKYLNKTKWILDKNKGKSS